MKTLLLTLLLVSMMSFGQIVSYDTNDTIIFDIPNDPNGIPALFDINNDGINDFQATISGITNPSLLMWGLTDSSDIIHRTFVGSNFSGYELINMTDSTLSNNSPWMYLQQNNPTAITGSGMFHWTIPGYVSYNLNSRYYVGFRFFIEGADFISRPHYGCMDVTLTQDERLVIHGWSYETQPNIPITCSDSFLNACSPTFSSIIEIALDSYTSSSGTVYTTGGFYSDTIQNAAGCDSIISIALAMQYTGIGELNSTPKQLIKIVDVLGRETPFKPNTPLLYIYNDGTVERKVVLK